jgi:hypothetical protein
MPGMAIVLSAMNRVLLLVIVGMVGIIATVLLSACLFPFGQLLSGLLFGFRCWGVTFRGKIYVRRGGRWTRGPSPYNTLLLFHMAPRGSLKRFFGAMYWLGGAWIVGVLGLACLVSLFFLPETWPLWAYGLIAGGAAGVACFFYLWLADRKGKDGALTGFKKLYHSPMACYGQYLFMKREEALMRGIRYREMDFLEGELPQTYAPTSFSEELPFVLTAAWHADHGRYAEQMAVHEGLDLSGLPVESRAALDADRLMYTVIREKDMEKAREIYAREGVADLLHGDTPYVGLTLGAYRFFVEGERKAGRGLLEKARSELEKEPYPGLKMVITDRIEELAALMNAAENRMPKD